MLNPGFLWGASTAPLQVEGNNIASDWWAREGLIPGMVPSGDAVDSYHRYPEDMALLAEAGLTAYRFGIEWSRIEPREGQVSRAALAHYRRMIDTAERLGLTPVVTLSHFTAPQWFAERGGWLAEGAVAYFERFVRTVLPVLQGVEWVVTINEPNMMALIIEMTTMAGRDDVEGWASPTVEGEVQQLLPIPEEKVGRRFIELHHAVRDIIRTEIGAKVGWTVANQALSPIPGAETKHAEVQFLLEDLYLEAARGDDFIGVQAYSTQQVGPEGLIPHLPHPDNTLVGTPYRPEALGIAIRHAWAVTEGVPVLVTENGIATADDRRRIDYTRAALLGLESAVADGIDVRGYLHWTLLDNYEWGHWEPTFGLIAVDRETFERSPKPSLAWLGGVARAGSAERG